MLETIDRVQRAEVKAFRTKLAGDAGLGHRMRAVVQADIDAAARRRLDFESVARAEQAKREADQKLKDVQAKLKKARTMAQAVEGPLDLAEAVKSLTLDMMGHGKKKAGGLACRKNRLSALNRLRAVAELSPEQEND